MIDERINQDNLSQNYNQACYPASQKLRSYSTRNIYYLGLHKGHGSEFHQKTIENHAYSRLSLDMNVQRFSRLLIHQGYHFLTTWVLMDTAAPFIQSLDDIREGVIAYWKQRLGPAFASHQAFIERISVKQDPPIPTLQEDNFSLCMKAIRQATGLSQNQLATRNISPYPINRVFIGNIENLEGKSYLYMPKLSYIEAYSWCLGIKMDYIIFMLGLASTISLEQILNRIIEIAKYFKEATNDSR
jgi:transcriptional regulator with XRE-family HTH domain